MSETEIQIAELHRRISNIIRIGSIIEADYTEVVARVSFGDTETGWLKMMTTRAGADRSWWMPEAGEQVVVLSPSGEFRHGVILPALFSTTTPAPSDDVNVRQEVHGDNFRITHNRSTRTTVIDAWDSQGTLELRARNIVIKTGPMGFFHKDHAGYAERITHTGGAAYQSETWQTGATVTGQPDHGHNPPEVPTP